MGIHGFFQIKILNKESTFKNHLISQIGETVSLKKFKGKRLCNDASLMIYQSILALEKVQKLTDADGNMTGHIKIIFDKIIQQKQAGIIQIWIFDSPIANSIKKLETIKRNSRKEKGEYKLNEQHVHDIQFLLNKLGIMYIVAPSGIEAEQYG